MFELTEQDHIYSSGDRLTFSINDYLIFTINTDVSDRLYHQLLTWINKIESIHKNSGLPHWRNIIEDFNKSIPELKQHTDVMIYWKKLNQWHENCPKKG